jgi:hypothetical protein
MDDCRISELTDLDFKFFNSLNSSIRKWPIEDQRSLAALGISARGSDAAQAPQLAEKNSSLYTWGFPENV